MAQRYRWPKDQREIAKGRNEALFICAIDGNGSDKSTGKYEQYGPCPLEKARFIFFFSFYLVHENLSYQDAYNKAVKNILNKPEQANVKKPQRRTADGDNLRKARSKG